MTQFPPNFMARPATRTCDRQTNRIIFIQFVWPSHHYFSRGHIIRPRAQKYLLLTTNRRWKALAALLQSDPNIYRAIYKRLLNYAWLSLYFDCRGSPPKIHGNHNGHAYATIDDGSPSIAYSLAARSARPGKPPLPTIPPPTNKNN